MGMKGKRFERRVKKHLREAHRRHTSQARGILYRLAKRRFVEKVRSLVEAGRLYFFVSDYRMKDLAAELVVESMLGGGKAVLVKPELIEGRPGMRVFTIESPDRVLGPESDPLSILYYKWRYGVSGNKYALLGYKSGPPPTIERGDLGRYGPAEIL